MGRWNKTCYSFKSVRDMLEEEIETTSQCMKIMYAMENCCDELTPNDETEWDFYDDFRDLKAEIHEEVELMDEDGYEFCESTVNYYLGELYDLCDIAGVWLAL
jgi:hypothetical protein